MNTNTSNSNYVPKINQVVTIPREISERLIRGTMERAYEDLRKLRESRTEYKS